MLVVAIRTKYVYLFQNATMEHGLSNNTKNTKYMSINEENKILDNVEF